MKSHLYHLVDSSPWPLLGSMAAFFLTSGFVLYMNSVESGFFVFFLGIVVLVFVLTMWWSDVVSEATYQGQHTLMVQRGMKIGFVLFLMTEVVFFSGFFWAFFHSSLSPSVFTGSMWPAVNIVCLNPWGMPLLNTFILLFSGMSLTWAHFAMIEGDYNSANSGFVLTISLAILFTLLQLMEYFNSPFNMTDGVYGTVFYSLTGLHGLHVMIGTIFISICYYSFMNFQFTTSHHIGFQIASWYWHFVDVVWLFLYLFVYMWGSW